VRGIEAAWLRETNRCLFTRISMRLETQIQLISEPENGEGLRNITSTSQSKIACLANIPVPSQFPEPDRTSRVSPPKRERLFCFEKEGTLGACQGFTRKEEKVFSGAQNPNKSGTLK